MIAKAAPEHSLTKPETLVAISGSGNVAQFTALKVIELGATVLSLSDSKGSLIAEKGYTKEFIKEIGQLKLKGGALESLAQKEGYTYHAGKHCGCSRLNNANGVVQANAHGALSPLSTLRSQARPKMKFPKQRQKTSLKLA